MTTWYIAGPMTGLPDYNYPAFHRAEKRIRDNYPDDTVLNPAASFGGDTTLPRETYLRAAIESVLRADRVLTLEGWEMSVGACTEVLVARQIGIDIYHTPASPCADQPTWDEWVIGRCLQSWRGVE